MHSMLNCLLKLMFIIIHELPGILIAVVFASGCVCSDDSLQHCIHVDNNYLISIHELPGILIAVVFASGCVCSDDSLQHCIHVDNNYLIS